ncbi:MAG: protein kinase [Elusimicrobiales bacterium]|nr:protein kinase [Elusimicrobiales bacterium]
MATLLISLICISFSFSQNSQSLPDRAVHHLKDDKTSFTKIDIDTNSINHYLEHHLFEENIRDPYRILRSWHLIRRKPEKVADTFLDLISSISENEQKRLIERYSGQLSVLLEELDKKNSVKFEPVFEILTRNKFPIEPANFENLRPIAEDIIRRYVDEYNQFLRRMPPERRTIEISTSTLNYENAVNKLVEFTRRIRTNPHSSLPIADNLSVKFSTNTSVQNTLSYLFLENSKYQEAEKYASKSIEIDSKENFEAYTLRSQARYSLKNIKGAIEDIKKASEIDPSDETARLLATYFSKQSDFSSSKLSAVKDSFSSNSSAFETSLPASSKKMNTYQDINFSSSPEITDDDKKASYYLKMSQIKAEMKDYPEALKYVNKAIEKNPSNLDSYIERANIYNLMGNYTDAINDTTYVLRHDPNNIFALNIRAWALYRKGELDGAYLDTSKAIDIKPNFADAMFLRALIYEKQSRYDDMLRDLEKASRLNPAYTSYFKDAIASYSYRAPNFMSYYDRNRDIFSKVKNSEEKTSFNIKRFSILLMLTIVGGVLIGISLLHMLSPKVTRSTTNNSSLSVSDTITPNIFYEGVASGKYKILKKIGQGGMGTVYLAVDQSLNREVAIKKMNEDIKMNEREKQRFLEEARTVAMLHHPNIIEIYTIFEEKGDLYLVFEYIDGTSLDKKLDLSVRMPFFEVKDIIISVAKALKYAHSKNVIHRDLKLSNIMISNEGIIKVTDFGLAKVVREAKARYSSTEVVGSPAYMAPEQDLGIFLKESDLYSLGVCIYELLVGELPFSGPDYHYQKERKLYTPLSQIVAGLPKNLDRIISKLLEPDPQYRYHTADEFLSDFEKLS